MIWPFSKKSAGAPSDPQNGPKEVPRGRSVGPVLSVYLDNEEVCLISSDEVPTEKLPLAVLSGPGQCLRFIASNGAVRSYELSSVFEEGLRFVHLSVRVSPGHAVQVDALLTTDGEHAEDACAKGGKGIRLEPFYLPECPGDSADLVGKGLFQRGLHYPGRVTPGNVSLLCLCDHCQKTFRMQSFHVGFSNLVYFYCSKYPHTLATSSYLKDAPPVLGAADPASLARLESTLPDCSTCGGTFRYLNSLRCPHCLEPYIDFRKYPEEREREYYGNCLYGEDPQRLE